MEQNVEELEFGVKHTQAFTVYMQEVAQIPDINSDEFDELIEQLKNPKTRDKAKNRLIEGNLKLVVAIAHKWKNLGVSLEDLVAEGNLALTAVADKYDNSLGRSFSTYAQWWINTAMRKAINASKTVRTPIATELNKRRYERTVQEFEIANGRKPTEKEIEQLTGMSNIVQKNVTSIDNAVISLNQKIDNSDGDTTELGDMIAQEHGDSFLDGIIKGEDLEMVRKAVSMLDDRDRTIIEMRFGFKGKDYTLEEVSKVIGKTRERCRQLEKEAILSLQNIVRDLMNA